MPIECKNYYMSKRPINQPLSTVLLRAIVDSGLPFLTLEQETGVVRQSLMKFVAGEQSLRLDMADKLATYFGLRLEGAGKPAKAQKRQASRKPKRR